MDQLPTCPRCGYDQSGIVRAWADSCPLSGRCSECGWPFWWRDLLNEEYRREGRLFENARVHVARSFGVTLRRSLLPWGFWRWVRVENPINGRRLLLFALCGVVMIHTLLAALPATAAWLNLLPVMLPSENPWRLSKSGVLLRRIGVAFWPFCDDGPGSFWIQQSVMAFHPLACVAVLFVVLMPLTFLLLPATFRFARLRRAHLLRIAVYGLPLSLVVFDFPLLVVGAIQLIEQGLPWRWRRTLQADEVVETIVRHRWHFVVAALLLLQIAWWWCASGRYLRLPRPLLVAVLMSIFAMSLAVLVVVLVPGGGVWLTFGL